MSKNTFNLSKPFPLCPPAKLTSLPFELDEMAFANWLQTLADANDLDKCRIILSVLQTLNQSYPLDRHQIPGRTRLFFLERLASLLDPAAQTLSHPSDSDDAVADVQQITLETLHSEYTVWSYLELASAYQLLSQESLFKQNDYYTLTEKNHIITNGLQALSKGLLHISQTYAVPDSSLWYNGYQFYRIARINQLTDAAHNPEGHNIENAFKHILIFALSNTNQFSPQEMRTIYDLLGYYACHASLLRSVPQKKFKGIPWIYLKSDFPPSLSEQRPLNQDNDFLYIATVNVASKILEATFDRRSHHLPIDRLMLMRLAKTLTLNKQRKSSRANVQDNHLGTLGFNHVFNFLKAKEVLQENVSATSRSQEILRPGELRDLDFEITTLDGKPDNTHEINPDKPAPHAFHVVEFTDPSAIWQDEDQLDNGVSMQLLDKSDKGYGLLWTDNLIRPKVGNLIGLLHKTLTVGIIRWLAQSKETGMFMGVETLGSDAASVKVSNPGFPDQQIPAIYLPAKEPLKLYTSLIFINQPDFHPNEFIFISRNHKTIRYRQTKQLHLTRYVNHVEIVRSF